MTRAVALATGDVLAGRPARQREGSAPLILAALRERRSRPMLGLPGPDATDVDEMLVAAMSAPDHGRLRPWRFIVIDGDARTGLGDAFAAAHAARSPESRPEDIERARAKAHRAPMIIVVVAAPQEHPTIGAWEQRASAVCVAHGILLAADALGYGAFWRTGWLSEAPEVRSHIGLADHEDVTGWIYLGSPMGRPAPRVTPEPPVSWLT